jgi:hypothetical protein
MKIDLHKFTFKVMVLVAFGLVVLYVPYLGHTIWTGGDVGAAVVTLPYLATYLLVITVVYGLACEYGDYQYIAIDCSKPVPTEL